MILGLCVCVGGGVSGWVWAGCVGVGIEGYGCRDGCGPRVGK